MMFSLDQNVSGMIPVNQDCLYKIHKKECNNANGVHKREKVVVILPPLAELPQLSCKNTNCRNKKNYQKSKKLNTKKHLIKTALYKAGKINHQ